MKFSLQVDKTTMHGQLPNTYNLVNISSAPSQYIKYRLSTLPNYDSTKIVFMQLQRVIDICSKDNMLKQHGKKKDCIYIVDADDKNYDNKIKNLSMINRYKCVGKIIISKTKPLSIPDSMKEYQYINVVNQHHSKRIHRLFNAVPLVVDNIGPNTVVRVMKTFDDHAGSINGIMMYLHEYKIPSVIDQATVSYKEGWMTTAKKPTVFTISQSDQVIEHTPDNDKYWTYKTGYDSKINTIRGPRDVELPVKTPKQDDDKKRNIFAGINRTLKKVWEYIGNITSMMWQVIITVFGKPKPGKEAAHSSTVVVNNVLDILSNISIMWMMAIKMNASSDIKKANKMLANYQVSKMMSKSGGMGDQTALEIRQTDEFNTYLTGLTSYNLQESLSAANRIAVKKQMARKMNILAMLTIGYIPINIAKYGPIIGTSTLLPLIVASLTDKLEPEVATVILMTLSSPSGMSAIFNACISYTEIMIKPSKQTRIIRMGSYLVIRLLII